MGLRVMPVGPPEVSLRPPCPDAESKRRPLAYGMMNSVVLILASPPQGTGSITLLDSKFSRVPAIYDHCAEAACGAAEPSH
jgi:hypothetical protein